MELYLRWLAQNEREPDKNLPLGIILCAGKNTEQIELLELGTAGIYIAEYLTVLPPAEVLREKLHQAIETARARMEAKAGDGGTEDYQVGRSWPIWAVEPHGLACGFGFRLPFVGN
jgi:hypothetical protein